jgi:hypothetical protein
MALFHEGYAEARAAIAEMNEADLLAQIDALFGRDNLPENYTIEELRLEAYDQTRREFTDTTSREFELVDFYTRLHRAMSAG